MATIRRPVQASVLLSTNSTQDTKNHGWPFRRGEKVQPQVLASTTGRTPTTSTVYGDGRSIVLPQTPSSAHPVSMSSQVQSSHDHHQHPTQSTQGGLPPPGHPSWSGPPNTSQYPSVGSHVLLAPWQHPAPPPYQPGPPQPVPVNTAPSIAPSASIQVTSGSTTTDPTTQRSRSIRPWRRKKSTTADSVTTPTAKPVAVASTIPTLPITTVISSPSVCPSIGPSYLQTAATAVGALAASYLPGYWGTAGCAAVGLSSLGYSAAKRIYDANSDDELSRLSIGQQIGNYFRRANVGCSASLLTGVAAPLLVNAVTGSTIFSPESVIASTAASCAVGKLFQPSEASVT